MINIFYYIFEFVSERKVLFSALLISYLLLAGFVASKLQFEENISKLIPQDDQVKKATRLLDNLKINDRLVVHLYQADSIENDPQELIGLAAQFGDSIQENYAEYIGSVDVTFPDENIEKLYSYFYENLPHYLTSEDYAEFTDRIQGEGLGKVVPSIYKALQSPLGIGTKQMLIKDPLGMTSFPLKRLRNLQRHDNIQLYQNHLFTKDKDHLIFFINLLHASHETANNAVLVEGIERTDHLI